MTLKCESFASRIIALMEDKVDEELVISILDDIIGGTLEYGTS